MTPAYIAGGTAALLVLIVVGSYNRFVHQRQLIDNSWSNVDTELKRRYDLIPNLVETVKGYAAHERQALAVVIAARSQAMASRGTPESQAGDENLLAGALRSLLAVSEAYPDLKANEHFLELQQELVTTENRIQAARRIYNGNVRDFNTRVESVPSNVVAKLFGFARRPYVEFDTAVGAATVVSVVSVVGGG